MRYTFQVMAAVGALAAAALPLAGSAPAGAATTVAYVAPGGSPGGADFSCATAAYSDINKAISAVQAGGSVVVCRGVYHTQAVVTKPLRLTGQQAVIDAAGQKPVNPHLPGGSGIVVFGTHSVVISGFTVRNAGFDGILVGQSYHVQLNFNTMTHNGDVGIDFNGTTRSQAYHNTSAFNHGGGYLIADDLGPAWGDVVSWNVADHNPGGCGVIIAGHTHAGVWDNVVGHNRITANGTLPTSPGAGVVIATAVTPERVSGNVVVGNTIRFNGLAGVTLHSHRPGQDLNGNQILDNKIGTNNVLGDPIGLAPPAVDHPDMATTGILIGSSSQVSIVISGNHIRNNVYGIYLDGLVQAMISGNAYVNVSTHIKIA
jgi:nitrous oxidase accessory protein NosD